MVSHTWKVKACVRCTSHRNYTNIHNLHGHHTSIAIHTLPISIPNISSSIYPICHVFPWTRCSCTCELIYWWPKQRIDFTSLFCIACTLSGAAPPHTVVCLPPHWESWRNRTITKARRTHEKQIAFGGARLHSYKVNFQYHETYNHWGGFWKAVQLKKPVSAGRRGWRSLSPGVNRTEANINQSVYILIPCPVYAGLTILRLQGTTCGA